MKYKDIRIIQWYNSLDKPINNRFIEKILIHNGYKDYIKYFLPYNDIFMRKRLLKFFRDDIDYEIIDKIMFNIDFLFPDSKIGIDTIGFINNIDRGELRALKTYFYYKNGYNILYINEEDVNDTLIELSDKPDICLSNNFLADKIADFFRKKS